MNIDEKIKAVRALRAASAQSKETVELVPESEHVKAPEITWCAFKYGQTCTRCKCFENRNFKGKDGKWRPKMDLQDHQQLIALKEGIELAYDGNW